MSTPDNAERVHNIDTAVIFAGAPLILDGAVRVAKILRPRHMAIAHADSWVHFSDSMENAVKAFEDAGMGGLIIK